MEETYTVSVDTTLRDLTDFALSQGTTLKELKRLNPAAIQHAYSVSFKAAYHHPVL